jgi:uncharacterized SAM-binding protein YcdF (DUF218 family)
MEKKVRILAILFLLIILLARLSGKLLVVDEPGRSGAILVLAGETDVRFARALELYRQGYAAKIIIDVPADTRIYSWTQLELARKYIETLPESKFMDVCPIRGQSTRDEAKEAAACLQVSAARNVLLVTSDFHTRRALSTFSKEIPNHTFTVAAAYDAAQFGAEWWRHRQWAKTNLDEWLRLVWWEVVDRWR